MIENGCGLPILKEFLFSIGAFKINKLFLLAIVFILFSCSFKKDVHTISNEKYWTNDLNEVELVMSYIMKDTKQYRYMTKMNDQEKVNFLNDYFYKLDPDTTTIDNEALQELNNRALECKALFSDFDSGILSDRAKIYIVYGPPKEKYKNDINNTNLITWKYEIKGNIKEFNFISDNFGSYKLID